jgi:EAL domain-containing protein (putative c-di-GMP-specific phosphodiesterase class I)
LGITLSIDDFGTGFSSLSYLKKLPVNELKIDKSFIIGMLENNNDRIIVQSTINMGHELGLIVVAEGIENAVTMNRIRDMGCDYFQGYFMGEPDSSDSLLVMLDKHALSEAQ